MVFLITLYLWEYNGKDKRIRTEPPTEYTTEGFRQINQAIETVENQLNTSINRT